jgi:hypothetical protein
MIKMMNQGYTNLILDVLLLTKSDLKMRSKKQGAFFQNKHEALTFVESEWFEALCIAVRLDPDAARERLLNKGRKSS